MPLSNYHNYEQRHRADVPLVIISGRSQRLVRTDAPEVETNTLAGIRLVRVEAKRSHDPARDSQHEQHDAVHLRTHTISKGCASGAMSAAREVQVPTPLVKQEL